MHDSIGGAHTKIGLAIAIEITGDRGVQQSVVPDICLGAIRSLDTIGKVPLQPSRGISDRRRIGQSALAQHDAETVLANQGNIRNAVAIQIAHLGHPCESAVC